MAQLPEIPDGRREIQPSDQTETFTKDDEQELQRLLQKYARTHGIATSPSFTITPKDDFKVYTIFGNDVTDTNEIANTRLGSEVALNNLAQSIENVTSPYYWGFVGKARQQFELGNVTAHLDLKKGRKVYSVKDWKEIDTHHNPPQKNDYIFDFLRIDGEEIPLDFSKTTGRVSGGDKPEILTIHFNGQAISEVGFKIAVDKKTRNISDPRVRDFIQTNFDFNKDRAGFMSELPYDQRLTDPVEESIEYTFYLDAEKSSLVMTHHFTHNVFGLSARYKRKPITVTSDFTFNPAIQKFERKFHLPEDADISRKLGIHLPQELMEPEEFITLLDATLSDIPSDRNMQKNK